MKAMAKDLIATNTLKYFKMKRCLLILLTLLSYCVIAKSQQVYKVLNFSDKYDAEVSVPKYYDYDGYSYDDDTTDISLLPVVSIIDKQTKKILINQAAHLDISYEINEEGLLSSNIVELPYGEQNVIICDDFNCDGEDDLAIKIGNLSCYGGPAYNVYIADKGELKLHEEFSRLAQEYCGFFESDCEKKEIYTMTKSGCCWHQYSTYSLINGEPIIKETIEDDAMGGSYSTRTITTWNDGQEVSKVYPLLDYSELIFSFLLEKNNKRAIVFLDFKGILIYVLLNKDGEIEFDFSDDFFLTKKDGRDILSFTNDNAEYNIYSNNSEVGIIVKTNGKTYEMKGNMESKESSLDIFFNETEVENLHITKGLE